MAMNSYLSDKIFLFRFLGLIFVLLIHASLIDVCDSWATIQYNIQFYSEVFRPIYFIISGFLFFYGAPGTPVKFSTEIYSKKLKKRINTLLIPFIIVHMISHFMLFCLRNLNIKTEWVIEMESRSLSFPEYG